MTKASSAAPAAKTATKQSESGAKPVPKPQRQDGMRETVESIVVAFILAFLFRTFEAEAFVIPTGSMAPTLLGRHKDIECDKCKLHFTVGASDEVDDYDNYYPYRRLETAFCPNCRFENQIKDKPVFKGDRILVNKFPFEIGEPERFEVVVFKYPEDPKTNYIKRLVGLPGETIKIERGDLFSRTSDTDPWKILEKKDPNKQALLQQLVYDNNHPEKDLHAKGWPERWIPVAPSSRPGDIAGWGEDAAGWRADVEGRTFSLKKEDAGSDLHWLRYQHVVPTRDDWNRVADGQAPTRDPAPQLVTDFCGYNSYTGGQSGRSAYSDFTEIQQGLFWVGDLTVSFNVSIAEPQANSSLLLELNEGPRRYRCKLDVNAGTATLSYVDEDIDSKEERTVSVAENVALKGAGEHRVSFGNVDDRLSLWIDGDLVSFKEPTAYDPPALSDPRDSDLLPVGIAATGLDAQISNLLLERDIYYRAEYVESEKDHRSDPASRSEIGEGVFQQSELIGLLSSPEQWNKLYSRSAKPAIFDPLGKDEYFMLGDNSPRSKDSRLWSNTRQAENRHAVPRSALVGKAFFVYWPHGVPFLNNGQGYAITYHKESKNDDSDVAKDAYPQTRVPFYPNVERMKRIR